MRYLLILFIIFSMPTFANYKNDSIVIERTYEWKAIDHKIHRTVVFNYNNTWRSDYVSFLGNKDSLYVTFKVSGYVDSEYFRVQVEDEKISEWIKSEFDLNDKKRILIQHRFNTWLLQMHKKVEEEMLEVKSKFDCNC